MKNLTLIFIFLFSQNIYAKMYKCETNGEISYQQTPCKMGTGNEIKNQYHYDSGRNQKKSDISKNILIATEQYNKSLATLNELYESSKISYDRYLYEKDKLKEKYNDLIKAYEAVKASRKEGERIQKDADDFLRELRGY